MWMLIWIPDYFRMLFEWWSEYWDNLSTFSKFCHLYALVSIGTNPTIEVNKKQFQYHTVNCNFQCMVWSATIWTYVNDLNTTLICNSDPTVKTGLFSELKKVYLEETNNGDLVVFNKLLGGINRVEGDGWGSGLLLNPWNDGVGCSAARVFSCLSVSDQNKMDH